MLSKDFKKSTISIILIFLVIFSFSFAFPERVDAFTEISINFDKIVYEYRSTYSGLLFKCDSQYVDVFRKNFATQGNTYIYYLHIFPKLSGGSLSNNSTVEVYDSNSGTNIDILVINKKPAIQEINTCKGKSFDISFKVFQKIENGYVSGNGPINSVSASFLGGGLIPSVDVSTPILTNSPLDDYDGVGWFKYEYKTTVTINNEGEFDMLLYSGNDIVARASIIVGDHQYDDGVVTREATETQTGILTKTCQVCGNQITETIPKVVEIGKNDATYDLNVGDSRVPPLLFYPNPNMRFESDDESVVRATLLSKQQVTSDGIYLYKVGFLALKSGETAHVKAYNPEAGVYVDTFTFNISTYQYTTDACVGHQKYVVNSLGTANLPNIVVSGPSADYNVFANRVLSFDPYTNYTTSSGVLNYYTYILGTFNEKGTYTVKAYDAVNGTLDNEFTFNVGDHQYTEEITKEPTYTSTGVLTKTCSVCEETITETLDKIPYDIQLDIGSYQSVDIHCDDLNDTSELIIKSSDESVAGASAKVRNETGTGTDLDLTVFANKTGTSTVTVSNANDGTVYGTVNIVVNATKEETSRICIDKEISISVPFISNNKNDDPSFTFSNDLDFDLVDSIDSATPVAYDSGLLVGNVVPHNTELTLIFKEAGTTDLSLYNANGDKISTYHLTIGNHNYSLTNKTEPTCIERSKETFICKYCGDSYVEEVGEFADHSWSDNYTIDTEPTCTSEGWESIHCTVCEKVKEGSSRAIDKLDHTYGDWIITKSATCIEDGIREKICSGCGDTITETISARGHIWRAGFTVDKEVTCTEDGIKSIHCSACDTIKEGSERSIPATGHQWSDEYVIDTEATCTTDGSKSIHCSICDIVKEGSTEIISAEGHTYSEWIITKEATCDEAGSKEMTCSKCGDKIIEEISAEGHAYGEWIITKEATCDEAGSKEMTCSKCGDKIIEEIPSLGHTWNDDYTVDIEATCTNEGSMSIHCSVCDSIKEGSTVIIPANGHVFGEWITVKESSYTETGIKERICEVCGFNEQTEIPVLMKISISDASVTNIETKTYTGKAITQTFELSLDGNMLIKDTDYITSYENNINAGTAILTVTGIGKYTGTITKTFTIKPKAVDPTITLSSTSYTYDGKVKTPSVTVKDGDVKLTTSNYTVTYASGRKNAGTYKVTVTLKDNYSGVASKTFTIKPKTVTPAVTLSSTSYTYDGKVKKPSVTVKTGTTKLTTASYTVTYASGRKNVGIYKVTVKLKGNYSGSKVVSFKINPKGTTISSLDKKNTSITVKWNKQSTKMATSYITGYQIQTATNSAFTFNQKNTTVTGYSKVSKEITGLLSGTKYYVRIRTYKTVNGNKYYSPWSTYKTVTTSGTQRVFDQGKTGQVNWKLIGKPKEMTLVISGTGKMGNYVNGVSSSPWNINGRWDYIKYVEIKSGVTSIGSWAFSSLYAMKYITIPDSVTCIGDYAFASCSNLTSIVIPKNVTKIGEATFHSCESMTDITIPNKVTSIGVYTFCGCENLKSIKIPTSVKKLGENAFLGCKKLSSLTIPDSVTSIGRSAFENCTGLTSLTIPFVGKSARSTGEEAMYSYCDIYTNEPSIKYNLRNIVVTGGNIKQNAFNSCSYLKTIKLSEGITGIGNNAFWGCQNMTSITIPSSITKIGTDAFYNCNSLTTIYYGSDKEAWNKIMGVNNIPSNITIKYS